MKKDRNPTGGIALSVVIPLYNEEAALTKLFDRLYPVLDGIGIGYEVVFVDDGSRDRSATLLHQQHKLRPDATRVLLLRRNSGRQLAIMTGLDASKGDRVITLGAELQNPPEEIPRLLAEMDRGHDYVGGIRRQGAETRWGELVSRTINGLRERLTRIRMTDPGCMLRAYGREVVNAVLTSEEAHTFVPALAYVCAANPSEIEVEQTGGADVESKHPLYELIHLNFDLMTGFSLVPLQVFSLVGIGSSLLSFAFGLLLAIRRLILGPEAGGLFTLFGFLFLFTGVILFGIGLLGGYLGRMYERTRWRTGYPVRKHLRPRWDSVESEA